MITLTDLYDTYETPLRRFAKGLTHNDPNADDLVQETFVRAIGHIALLQTLKQYEQRAWLYRTLKNLFLDAERARQRQAALTKQMEQEIPAADYLPQRLEATNPFDLIPDQFQDVFQMRYQLGLNSQEIAERLGIPATTVRSRLHLGMKQLRSQKAKLL